MHAERRPLALPLVAVLLCGALALFGCSRNTPESMIESGKSYLAKKDPKAAVIQFKAALQADPKSAEARFQLGRALMEAGDMPAAVVELSKAVDEHYDDAQVIPALSRALLLSGAAQKAATLYGGITLDDHLANAELKSTMALAWGVLGETAKAQEALAASLASQPDYPAALILQARIKASEGKVDDAMSTVERVLASHKDSYEAWNFKGDLLAGPKGDTKAAQAAYRNALEIEKSYVPAHVALVTLDLKANDIPAAKAQLEQMRAVLPKHPQTIFLEAQIALADGDIKKGRELVQQLARFAPNNVGVLQLSGIVDAATGSLLVAETHFSKALQFQSDLPFARRSLAKIYLLLGDSSKALRAVEPMVGPDARDAEALSLAGDAQLQLGDTRAAEALFLRAAKLNPNDPKLRTALALMTLSHGDAASAFQQLDTIAHETQDTAADMAIFSAHLRRREFDAAMQALDAMEKKRPKDANIYELRGVVDSAKKDFAAARKAYEQALALQPSRYSAVSSLAALDLREGKLDDARKRLDAAIAADPRNYLARMAEAEIMTRQGLPLAQIRQVLADGVKAAPNEPAPRVRLIELLLSRRQYSDALAVAQDATATLPDNPDLLDAMGRAQQLAGDTQQAVSTFRKLTSVEPKSARAQIRLADLYVAAGNREAAASSLQRALEIEPNQESAQARLMDLLVGNGQSKQALEMARAMQQRSPASPSGYLLEGAIQSRNKAPEAALEAYRNGLRFAKDSPELAVGYHKSLILKGRTADADALASSWMKAHPDDTNFEYYLGLLAITRNELERAQSLLVHVNAARPDNPLVLNNLAWVMAKRGEPGAIAYARRALELAPNRPALLDTLALALAADGQFAQALEVQKKCIEISPSDMGLRLNLARIAIQAGDKTLARTELERLSALGSKLPYHETVAKLLKSL